MAQVSLQVAAGPALPLSFHHHCAVILAETANAVAASATADLGAEVALDADDLACMFVLSHDGTAGSLTIELYHCEVTAGTFRKVTDNALQLLGLNSEVATDAIVLDVSEAANQGTILVGVCASAHERSSGVFVANLLPFIKLAYTTDAGWDGTSINEIAVNQYKHIPSGEAA